MSRVKQPNVEPRWRTYREFDQRNVRLDADVDLVPTPGDARRITIKGVPSANGTRLLRVPLRPDYDGDDSQPKVLTAESSEYTIDLDNTGLATASGTVGGFIDGSTVAATTDYLIWAIADGVAESITGVGITERPRSTAVSMPAGATLGASGVTVTVGTNEGNKYAVGARVLFRDGTSAGSNWNQAEITATAADTITVDLDADYGLTTNNNTSMASVTGVEVLQLDLMQPRVGGESDSYDSGKPYCYLGHIQTDASSNIRLIRRRGDYYAYPGGFYLPVNRSGITASESFQAGLGNWMPLGTTRAYGTSVLRISSGSGSIQMTISSDGGTNLIDHRQYILTTSEIEYQSAPFTLRVRDCSYHHNYQENSGTPSALHQMLLTGYFEQNW